MATYGYASVFAAGTQVQSGDGQDYYLKYMPPGIYAESYTAAPDPATAAAAAVKPPAAIAKTKGFTDEQILQRLIERIKLLKAAGLDEETVRPDASAADLLKDGAASPAATTAAAVAPDSTAAAEDAGGAPEIIAPAGVLSETRAGAALVSTVNAADTTTTGGAINVDAASEAAAGGTPAEGTAAGGAPTGGNAAGGTATDTQPVTAAAANTGATDASAEISAVTDGLSFPVFINITSPNGDSVEIVYKSTYSICGVRDDDAPDEPIILFLTRYDAKTDTYTEVADINGEKKWTVGSNGVFTRSVLLEEGENSFAIAACKAADIEAARANERYIEDDDIQVETFVILYRSQNVAAKISEVLKELTFANILKEIENK